MKVYLAFARKSFQNNMVYRMDYIAGIINAIVMIFVNISIWKAIYNEDEVLEGVQFKILVTYIVLSFLMQLLFAMEEYFIDSKVRSGLITSDLLKPINFRFYVFSYNVGTMMFRLVMQFVPALLFSILVFQLLPVFSMTMLFYFIVSAVLGYLVLYNLNFIVWVSSFWFYWSFSLVTIKDAAVVLFSGALIPLWYMPQAMVDFIELTPFGSIFYTPIAIYLGMIPEDQILISLAKQIIWIIVLAGLGQLLWHRATKRLVIQGG
jgi:ABC-2 type transport system permease protein